MTGPDRIWAWPTLTTALTSIHADDEDLDTYGLVEYIRRDPAVLAALPEVQALIAAEREACVKEALKQDHCGCPDEEGVWWDHDPAQVGREIAAAIRKRGEG